MNYTLQTTKNDVHEKRYTRCERLLVNHENVDHLFQYAKTPM